MRTWPSVRLKNPFKVPWWRSRSIAAFDQLPAHELSNGPISLSTSGFPEKNKHRRRFCNCQIFLLPFRVFRFPLRLVLTLVIVFAVLGMFGLFHQDIKASEDEIHSQEQKKYWDIDPNNSEHAQQYFWMIFPRLTGFWNGVRTLVPYDQWVPDPRQTDSVHQPKLLMKRDDPPNPQQSSAQTPRLPLQPEPYHPYPNYTSEEYLSEYHPVKQCYFDEHDQVLPPDIYAYPGLPQHMSQPFFGSHQELGLRHDVCFERFGRFGPYGYGYSTSEGGTGVGLNSENVGSDEIWKMQKRIDYRGVDWGTVQKKCYQKNKLRFRSGWESLDDDQAEQAAPEQPKKKAPRSAFVLRTWTDFVYTEHEILTLRSMINELAVKSGGEYDVHLLLHVHETLTPILASEEVRQWVIRKHVPKEFWGITTVWSQPQMEAYYPGPFSPTIANLAGKPIHHVYRSGHFALQWFAQEHPEYDYVWNWEMDVRNTGHNYEFHTKIGEWARKQPRKGLWERNAKFWIPAYHGNYTNFTRFVEEESIAKGVVPIWGPLHFPNNGKLPELEELKPPTSSVADNFEWGVGEEADFIALNPIFDSTKTNWVFRDDITGYAADLPAPPRRCAIVTVARFSRRMLDIMHRESYVMKHSAFPEMWPPTVALHHGLKAVYVPHPVFFDRKWPLKFMDRTFNYPTTDIDSPFGWGEHNWLGSSFYYNSAFSAPLWRRWLGQKGNNGRGGAKEEKEGTGRMCLRSTLHHPIKTEDAKDD